MALRASRSAAPWCLLAGLFSIGASAAVAMAGSPLGLTTQAAQRKELASTPALPAAAEVARSARGVIDDVAYQHAQRLVDIGGRKMNLYCTGKGSPAVILESGLADPTAAWGPIQSQLAGRTKVCSYDRAGIGFSEPSGRVSTSANVVEDLHALLRAASVAPPYVLVGHSFGGMNVRLFADLFMREVVGMVLVDPAHEDQVVRYATASGGPEPKRMERLARHRRCAAEAARAATTGGSAVGTAAFAGCIDPQTEEPNVYFGPHINTVFVALQAKPVFQAAQLSEYEGVMGISADQVRQARRSYGALPLVVLTRGDPPPQKDSMAQARWKMHDELAALSAHGIHRAAPGSGHYIQFDRPDLVLTAIEEVIAAAHQ